jgi:hypothetical protein
MDDEEGDEEDGRKKSCVRSSTGSSVISKRQDVSHERAVGTEEQNNR